MTRPPPRSTLFPYTTLFRSLTMASGAGFLTLTNTNSYTGNTLLNAGTLVYSAPGQPESHTTTLPSQSNTLLSTPRLNEARAVTTTTAGNAVIDTGAFNSTFT